MAESQKDIAIAFLHAAASGNVREAYRKQLASGFRHHNAYFPGDAESLMRGMEENAAKNPNKVLEVQRAIAELWDLGQPVPEDSPNEYGMF
jgi:hypothetical protein